MVIIASFDCANINLGICYIEYNENWKNEIKKINNKLSSVIENKKIKEIKEIIKKINIFLENIFKIRYINVINLLPNSNIKISINERTKKIKYLLNALDNMIQSDIILIEYQMGPNNKSGSISNQIVYHYTDIYQMDIKYGEINI